MEWFEFNEDQSALMAKFIGQIVRDGFTYEVKTIVGGWRIRLTGGF